MVKPDQNSSERSKRYVFSNERLSLRVILENMERSHWFEKIMRDADISECCKKCKLKNHSDTDGTLLTFKSLTCILFTIIFHIFLLHSSALENSATVHPQNLTNWSLHGSKNYILNSHHLSVLVWFPVGRVSNPEVVACRG